MPRVLVLSLSLLFAWTATAAGPHLPGPALAEQYREGVDVADYWVSEKLDGVRALWDGRNLHSRRGNRFAVPPWFTREFPDVPLDGELWMGRGTFAVLSGAVRRKVPDAESWRGIRYMVFDLPAHSGTFDDRLARLRNLFSDVESAQLGLVEQFRVADHAELMDRLAAVTAQGGEGLMLRRANSLHRAGRTADLLKVKLHRDAQAIVLAHLPGAGKYEGMLGALLVETPEGRRFKLGTGFSDAQRRHPPLPGATVTYRYRGKTAGGLPRFASFVGVRQED